MNTYMNIAGSHMKIISSSNSRS